MRALRVVMATDAEPLYQPLGWETVAREPYGGESVTIMRKRLGTS